MVNIENVRAIAAEGACFCLNIAIVRPLIDYMTRQSYGRHTDFRLE